MIKREVTVKDIDKKYDHPLAEIVQIASQFKSEVLLEYDKYRINAKSIMGIIAFNPSEGMNVTISADGNDEADAVDSLEKFLICRSCCESRVHGRDTFTIYLQFVYT